MSFSKYVPDPKLGSSGHSISNVYWLALFLEVVSLICLFSRILQNTILSFVLKQVLADRAKGTFTLLLTF